MSESRKGPLHAAARAVGLAANASTFAGLTLLFGPAQIADSTRRIIQISLLAGIALSLAGLVLLIRLARRARPGWGLVALVVLPLLICGFFALLLLAARG